MKRLLFCGVVLFLFSTTIKAELKTTNQSGSWENPNIWSPAGVPTSDDDVVINHVIDAMSIGIVDVFSIHIENNSSTDAYLRIVGSSDFTSQNYLNIVSANFDSNAGIELDSGASLLVKGNSTISRLTTNLSDTGTFQVALGGSSTLFIEGNCTVNYSGTSLSESILEFDLFGSSVFTVQGAFSKFISGGNVFGWEQRGTSILNCIGLYTSTFQFGNSMYYSIGNTAAFQVLENASFENNSSTFSPVNFTSKGLTDFRQDLELKSTASSGGFSITIDDPNSIFKIGGNMNLDGAAVGNINIGVFNNAKIYLGGDISRLGDFGQLTMSADATFVYTGGDGQKIVESLGAGTDAFSFTNIEIDIPVGDSIVLEKDMVVDKRLTLTSGIIKSRKGAMLIINDGAQLNGGSPVAYVEGPIKKINLDAGVPFLFPLGHQTVYAPLTLETSGSRSAANGEYEVKYLNCPPPWPGYRAINIEQLSSEEFWSVERSEGSADINVRLHWTDATAQGITNTDDLVVAMYNPDATQFPTFPEGWTSIGQEGLIGGVGDGVSGSIMNIGTCPPPWGIELFSFASTSNSNALPVEMESFDAKIVAEIVDINFETVNEIGVERFIIEKSTDGSSFSTMGELQPKGQSDQSQRYNIKDYSPEIGSNYYRIKKVDEDGMFAYTNIRFVSFYAKKDLVAFPNPVSERLIINGEWLLGAKELVIFDSNGRIVYRESLNGRTNSLIYELPDLNMDNSGLYVLEVRSNSSTEQIKLVKN